MIKWRFSRFLEWLASNPWLANSAQPKRPASWTPGDAMMVRMRRRHYWPQSLVLSGRVETRCFADRHIRPHRAAQRCCAPADRARRAIPRRPQSHVRELIGFLDLATAPVQGGAGAGGSGSSGCAGALKLSSPLYVAFDAVEDGPVYDGRGALCIGTPRVCNRLRLLGRGSTVHPRNCRVKSRRCTDVRGGGYDRRVNVALGFSHAHHVFFPAEERTSVKT